MSSFTADQLSAEQTHQLERYRDLLYRWSAKINLVSPGDREQIFEKHILPSLGMVSLLQTIPHRRIMDLGSGAGLPGIPIKVALPQSQMILVESRRKRVNFLREVIRQLAISDIEVVNERIEAWENPSGERVDVVVARAVKSIEIIAQWVKPHLAPEGFIITTMPSKEPRSGALYYARPAGAKVEYGVWRP